VDVEKVEAWILEQHKRFKFRKIVLDQYQSQATIQRLQKSIGVSQVGELTWTYKSKTESYSYLKELFNSDKIALYRHETAIAQLINLQVFYLAGGHWTVSGGKGKKVDDYCSVLAAIANISRTAPRVGWARFA
jgi:phage terminase large subunit-like protein